MPEPSCENCRWRELHENEAAPRYRCRACKWEQLEFRRPAALWEPRRWRQKVGDFLRRCER